MRGARVMGYDIDPARMSYEPQQYKEAGPDGTGDFNHDGYLDFACPNSYAATSMSVLLNNGDGTSTETWRSTAVWGPGSGFARLLVSPTP